MKQYEIERLSDTLHEVSLSYNNVITRVNQLTSDTYTTLEEESANILNTRNKVAVLSDMLTDLKVLKGSTSFSPSIADLPVISNSNIEIKNGRISLATSKSIPVVFSVDRSSIESNKPYRLLDQAGNTKNLFEVFRYDSPTRVYHQTLGYDLQVVLEYPKMVVLNNLILNLPDIPKTYPFVEGISYVIPNTNTEVDLLDIKDGQPNYDLDTNRELDNSYSFNFETIQTSKLILKLSSKTSDTFEFKSIVTSYNKYESNGEVVLGPLVSDTPILKVALRSESISSGIKLAISTNNLDWVNMTDVLQVDENVERKIAAFNTINESSFKSSADVRNVYVKITIQAENIEDSLPNYQAYTSYREDGAITLGRNIEEDRLSAYKLSTDDLSYGLPTFITNFVINEQVRANIEKVLVNGSQRVLGFDNTRYSLCNSEYSYSNVEATLNMRRIPASSLIDATSFDAVTSKLYDINMQYISTEINAKMFDQACAKLKVKEDTYKIIAVSTGRYITKNISKQFIENSNELLYQVPYEDLKVVNSLGNIVAEIPTKNLLKIDDIFFINLIDILSIVPKVEDLVLNPLYPLVSLKENEYALENGKVVLGKGTVVNYTGYKTIRTIVPTKLTVSYQNGNIWERQGPLYTYHHEQIEKTNKEASIIKLNHTCIEKGSLTIYEYNEHNNLSQADVYLGVTNTGKDVWK